MRRLIWMLLLALPAGNVFAQTTGTIPVVNNERQQWRMGSAESPDTQGEGTSASDEGAIELTSVHKILLLHANYEFKFNFEFKFGIQIRNLQLHDQNGL